MVVAGARVRCIFTTKVPLLVIGSQEISLPYQKGWSQSISLISSLINDIFIAKVVQAWFWCKLRWYSSLSMLSILGFLVQNLSCFQTGLQSKYQTDSPSNEYISSPLKEQACFDSLAEKPLSRRPYFPIWSIGDALEVSRSGLCWRDGSRSLECPVVPLSFSSQTASDLISPQGVDNQISVILSSHTNAPLCSFLQHHAKTTRTNDVIQRRFRVDTKVSIR